MNFNPVQVIRQKRDGTKLPPADIERFIKGLVSGNIPEYQASALLMAVFFQGMDLEETAALTQAMIQSGRQVRFKDHKPKIDKHSTGGVGDKVSIILAPLVASLGVDVPMVAGRGLGHTGGTLDKLESIPGFSVDLSIDEFIRSVEKHGLAIMGQTQEFVPADKLLYALRDVTGTVECIPLICASILSKKVAEGITGLVLDIKVGSGAFMKNQKEAEKLSRALVSVGTKLGLKIRVLITDMSQPLGYSVGNALEILECLDVLNGHGPSDVRDLTIELAAHMLVLGEKSSSLAAARTMAKKSLQDGSALKKFNEMCLSQHATIDIIHKPELIRSSHHTLEIPAKKTGHISKMDTEQIGLLTVELGGGRLKTTDKVDHSVGFRFHCKLGDEIKKGSSIATIFYSKHKPSDKFISSFYEAVQINGRHAPVPKLVKKVITA